MDSNCETILEVFHRTEKGFDAIQNGLTNFIIDSLCETVGLDSWAATKKSLGIYTLVRRVKSRDRLAQKIVALTQDGENITRDDFYRRIPDIVGARIVCLHPDDLFAVAIKLRDLASNTNIFRPPPSPLKMLRVRYGAFSMLPIEGFRQEGFHIDPPHGVGYSSIHFVFRLGKNFRDKIDRHVRDPFVDLGKLLTTEDCLVEVQLRTILEEAWGELDHWIRYEDPRLENDEHIQDQFKAFAAYIQAGNYHISVIRRAAKRVPAKAG